MATLKSTKGRLVLSLLLVSAASAAAQQPAASPQKPTGTTTLEVTSRLTVEDVTVTDAQGKPVHGLKQADFTVKEDGKPQDIQSLQEYGAETPSVQPAPPALPPNVYTNAQGLAAATSAVNIILLDALNTAPALQATARQQSLKYLEEMPPETQIAILEMGNGLRIVQGFTTDRAALAAAMRSYTPETILSAHVHTALEMGDLLNIRSQATTDALDQIAAFLSGIKGRKNLIWFTTGLSQITAFGPFQLKYANLNDYTPELQKAYGLLTAAQVAVYPVDPRGVMGGEWLDHNSMGEIAAATGGEAFYNRNDLDAALGEAIAGGADYYLLSYVPPLSKYDGKYHKIDVKVDRPGLHLQYREGYTAMDLTKPLAEKKPAKNAPAGSRELHDAVDHSIIPSTQLLFEIRVAPSTAPAKPGGPPAGLLNPKLNGKPLVRYDFLYQVPADQLTLIEGPDGTRKGAVEVDTVAYGDDGVKLNVVREMVNLNLRAAQVPQFMRQPLQVPVQLDLPPGKLVVHAGVLDEPSQRVGSLEIPQTVTER